MIIHGSLVLLLMAGILSPTIAHQGTLGRRGSIPMDSSMFGYVNTTYEEIENFDMQLCQKNGGPRAYEIQKSGFQNFQVCIFGVFSEIQLENSASNTRSYSRTENVYKMHCRKISSYENCVKSLTETMKMCLDPDKHESANILYNIISGVMRFLCKDDAAALAKYDVASHDSCVRNKSKAFTQCANETIVEYVQATIPDGAAVGGLGKLHLLVPDVEKCKVVENFQHCAIEELKSCSSPIPVDLLNSIFTIVKKEATCNQLLKSHASPANVVNVLFISAMMAMSLRFT